MWPFVDPNTKKKVRFEEDLAANKDGTLGPDALLKEVGGNLEVRFFQITTEVRHTMARFAIRHATWQGG